MIVSEEEARTKWCPMARVIQYGGHGNFPPAGNREIGPSGATSAADALNGACRCITSECMAWREAAPKLVYRGHEEQWVDVGFCGAFGHREA
ncbi:hypothetical protein FW320_06535 [Azospirillum sp. Vi22]|uniref:hypothetical protein n=1 Tax=Azospirillum baldaniorum TaxID=1064539 RepID=UPI00157B2BB7|nr:hypothetical protein [Azospirillum baldaniorum]NUB05832.1 hypothetical protein [Azospirillum baldaniorum]